MSLNVSTSQPMGGENRAAEVTQEAFLYHYLTIMLYIDPTEFNASTPKSQHAAKSVIHLKHDLILWH